MKKPYYLFNPGRAERRDNTLKFTPTGEAAEVDQRPRYLPVEGVRSLHVFGSIDANSAFYNYLGRQSIPVHFFDYYQHYTGSFAPRDYLLAGKVLIAQTQGYLNRKRRLYLAKAFVDAATDNMLKNLQYYRNRNRTHLALNIEQIEQIRAALPSAKTIEELMGLEGNCRKWYYEAFDTIISTFSVTGRSKQPPKDEVNALISFGNSICYTAALDAIYHSQLNPTISYLHEPGFRRYSLALDIAEIFKPILVDRLIFKLCNRREIRPEHFETVGGAVLLTDRGRKIWLRSWESKLAETIEHRRIGKRVSYRRLLKLECYKLIKYLMEIEPEYSGFKIWW